MSSTQIQLERERVVSVQTQSITALSSVRKGTIRKLEEERMTKWMHNDKKVLKGLKNFCHLQVIIKGSVCFCTLGRERGSGS